MQETTKNISKIEFLSKQIVKCEDILNEDVFISGLNNNNNTASLTYDNRGFLRNKGNIKANDMIKTSKMNNSNGSDTYEVKLKNGLTSYNITDINGMEVMHYFKKKFNHEKAQIKMGDESYDLEMKDKEFRNFMNDFLNKVNNVVAYHSNVIKSKENDIEFNTISLYPVPSSSNFNQEMVKRIVGKHTINGLSCQIVDSNLLKKDMSNLTIDNDFINKNKDYYQSQRTQENNGTHLQSVQELLDKKLSLPNIKHAIDEANYYTEIKDRKYTGKLIILWNNIKAAERAGKLTEKSIFKLFELFTKYQIAVSKIALASKWYDRIAKKTKKQQLNKIATAIKYSKGPSILKRKEEIRDFLIKYGYGNKLPKTLYDVCMWQPIEFEIKKIGNDIRMALMNYFQPNKDEIFVNNEVDKAKNTIVVVFDDNISGGSTLSDICTQLQRLGLKYIIPITFGKMRESYNIGRLRINSPENGFNYN